jgi:hypothetical protein
MKLKTEVEAEVEAAEDGGRRSTQRSKLKIEARDQSERSEREIKANS